ncbi:MAG: M24 family metallopeptidase [Mycoplasma sp.]
MQKNEVLINTIKENNTDGMFLISEVNRYWLTGLRTSFGIVIINNKGEKIFITDSRYILVASETLKDFKKVISISGEEGFDTKSLIKKSCDELGIKTLLIENEYFKLSELDLITGFEYKLFSSKFLRIIKDEFELKKLQASADIIVETVKWVWTWIKPGYTEKEVAKKIAIKFLELGAEKNSFSTIVSAGENGAHPHHEPSDYVIQEGDMVTVDLGCMLNSYASDMTRTFIVGKKPNMLETVEIYEVVKRSQELGLEHSTTAYTTFELDKACRDYIDGTKYKGLFAHGTGHGVGLEVHELPVISPKMNIPLLNNHVLTVEPGIYKAGIGGVRIEDTVVISGNKPIILTKECTKDLLFIVN